MGLPRPLLSFIFSLQTNTNGQFFAAFYVKIVHPVSDAGIWTHNLLDVSLLSLP